MAKDSISGQNSEEQEIDLLEILGRLWHERKFIFKVTFVFLVLGILVALFSSKVYTAQCSIVPQTGSKNAGGNLSGLAAMAGINLGGGESGELLSPKIYSMIINSVPFQKDLMQVKIKFQEYEEPVQLFDYYTDDKYQKFSLFGVIRKYTIDLPGVVIGALKGKDEKDLPIMEDSTMIESLSEKENICVKAIKAAISFNLNEKEGYFILAANMPEPLAAAQLVAAMQKLLQKYVTAFKIEKVENNLEFVEGRYQDAKKEFEAKQQELAAFRDANRNFALEKARTNEERLKTQSDLLFSVYSELAKQREQANIQVKETTPIFTVVDPVTVPIERTKPKRGLICIAFTILGGFIGMGLVLVLPFIAKISGHRKLAKWLPKTSDIKLDE